jgi:nitrite reductase/ring-hydroxylating ferredoxin subunit
MNREVVAKVNELSDGEMKVVTVGEKEILLLRVGDEYRAYAPKCPHHGAPLVDGAIVDGKLRCPWHQTVFDALTGKRVEPPALDNLPQFRTEIVGENVVALLTREIPAKETPRMSGRARGSIAPPIGFPRNVSARDAPLSSSAAGRPVRRRPNASARKASPETSPCSLPTRTCPTTGPA